VLHHFPAIIGGPDSESGTGSTWSSASPSAVAGESGTGSTGAARVLVDGQDQNANSPSCSTSGGNVDIRTQLNGSAGTAFAVLSDADPPVVTEVALDGAGTAMKYEANVGQGDAVATKNGNTYKITGHTTYPADSQHSFEVDVTCP
jgi:ipoprotein LpqH